VVTTWRLGRRPALDGLRGVAIALVLVGHSGPVSLQPVAWAGVTLFFGLSGFLITALLLEERRDQGRIDLGRFWARRARRLLPALFVMLAVTGSIMWGIGVRLDPIPVLAYYGNWVQATGGDLELWRHTWSLAIEEQFYLVWPLLIVAMRSRRALLTVCGVGSALSLASLLAHWHDFVRAYYGTDTRVWALLAGAALAAVYVGSTRRDPWAPRFLSASALRWLGARSYAIYLWHYPLTLMMWQPLGIALSFVIAEVSWRYVERPFLSRRLVHAIDGEVVTGAPGERRGGADDAGPGREAGAVQVVGHLERAGGARETAAG